MTTIQKEASRKDTLRVQMAHTIWNESGSAFFEEDIPFSARNNQKFARKLVTLYQKLTAGLSDPEFLVVDLGAGLGLLGYFFLTVLLETDPVLYAKTKFWSTDVDHLPTFKALDSHKICTKKKLDILAPDFEGKKPLLCFGSYVLDAIPPICLKLTKKTLQEVRFNTTIADNAHILETSSMPPKSLPLEKIVTTDPKKWPAHWLPQIADALEEESSLHPWNPEVLSLEDQKHIQTFINTQTKDGYFNAIPGLTQHLKSILAQMHPQGSYLISDFGFSNDLTTEQGSLASRYQLALFHAVCFPLVRHTVSQLGGQISITHRSLDQTQECLISHNSLADSFSLFDTETPDDGLSQRLDALLGLDDTAFLEAYPAFKKALTPDDASDYVLCKLLASRLFKLGRLKEILHWTGHMETIFDHLAPDAYLLTGWACQIQKDHKTAIACFSEVIKTCPHHSLAYGASAASALALGDFDTASKWTHEALKWARGEGYWIHVVTQCTMWYRSKQHKELKEALLWVKSILKTNPEQIPPRVKNQLSELVPLILK
jgi:tetratricopeptide (TPR) repeat protein